MKRVITIATACVAALLVALTIGVAAQDFNPQEKTFLTFSGPVELPGITLQAGTYVFRLADTPSRNVVQVMSRDEKDILGQWLFVQAQRLEVTGETVITFRETREGTTPAVQYWYYPGEKIGKEFIYPKDQALKIAQRTGATVKTEEGEVSASAAATTDTSVIKGSGVPAEPAPEATVAEAEVTATEPAPVTTESAETPATDQAVGTSGRSDQAPESTTASAELPRTASPLPLSGLLGLFSLLGAAGLRRFRQ
jgi:hypothetical protein